MAVEIFNRYEHKYILDRETFEIVKEIIGKHMEMNAYTEITVTDNGIGISEENINKIWDRFYRIDDVRNDEYGSNGLGLAMVKSIIELHGGEISVSSKVDEGTEFRIVLKD